MLTSLNIQNVVLIEKLTVSFASGLSALTGETGAGKSILLDSLGLALGARSESGLIRAGADQAQVSAVFEVASNHPALGFLREQGLEADPVLILRRVVTPNGRSRAFINDQPVSAGLLAQIGESLVEIHGQFETQRLLNARFHRDMLDDYGQQDGLRSSVRGAWEAWRQAEADLEDLRARSARTRENEDFLRQSIEDLDDLSPHIGEEARLSALRERLMKREQYLGALAGAHETLTEVENVMGGAWRALEKLGEEGTEMLSGLDRAAAEIQEVMNAMRQFSSDLDESEYSLSEIDDRLFALKAQARKHHCTIDDLPAKRAELAAALDEIEHQDERVTALFRAVQKARQVYCESAEALGAQRRKAAKKMDRLVNAELAPLKLEKARFETEIEDLAESEWGPDGAQRVQFLVATNPGAAPGPLGKIASGGEMSRFMLALKVVLAGVGEAGTLVFDEVDSGIGGGTADAVGERLARLAASRQVLVVTHSPQVAARAQSHMIVRKDGAKTLTTNVIALQERKERREEIARMLSGASVTEEARAAADKLLEAGA